VDTIEQAQERSGGPGSKHGNKGVEAAHAALYMMAMKEDIKKGKNQSQYRVWRREYGLAFPSESHEMDSDVPMHITSIFPSESHKVDSDVPMHITSIFFHQSLTQWTLMYTPHPSQFQ